ncbi:MAG: transcription antitermination factor NusB [Bacillota bacterium]|nr:transcription antitermination factor NusB [Bacillota bacterium]
MSRRNSREDIFKILFVIDANGNDDCNEALTNYFENHSDGELWSSEKITEEEKTYITDTINGAVGNFNIIDDNIKKYLKNWNFERISKVSLACLRLSLYEIIFIEDIPVKVSVNEAVEIAKKFGGAEDSKFVNGVLGEYIRNEIK